MAVNFNSTSSVNNFFSTSLWGANNSVGSGGINDLLTNGSITEYSSIKSGSYKKLLNAYYAKESTSDDTKKTEVLNNQSISNKANEANNALNELKKMDMTQENKDKVMEKIQKFVDDYNNIVDDLTKSDTKSVLQKGVWMTKAMTSYANVLKKVGIEVGADNKLTLNAQKFAETGVEQIESVFKGNMSVGSKISYKINQLEIVSINNGTTSYTNTGEKKSYETTSAFDKYL